MKRLLPLPVLLWLTLLLAGCSSYTTQVERGRSLAGVRHFFVVANANDNRALNHQLVAALTARGHQAATGPLTMMTDDTVAIVSYSDHWTWDFGDYLVYLQVSMRDRKTGQPYGNATFSTKLPTRKPPARITDELVAQLLPATP